MHTATTLLERTFFWPILQAWTSPGRVFALADSPAGTSAILQLLGCLMDRTTTFAAVDGPHLDAAIIHHTGSRRVLLEEADYVIASRGRTGGRISFCRRGTPDNPHRAACVLFLVESLEATGAHCMLTCPGVRGFTFLGIRGMDLRELNYLREVNRDPGRGVDALFLDRHNRIACIPRAARIAAS